MRNKENVEVGQLVCSNQDCRKKITAPLELFNRKFLCPYCLKPLGNERFTNNKDSESILEMAHSCYADYLQTTVDARDSISVNGKKLKEKSNILLENSKDYCRAAYGMGNPRAQLLLGEFWEKGYMGERGESYRYKIAEQYYEQVKSGRFVDGYDSDGKIKEEADRCLRRVRKLLNESDGGLTFRSLIESFGKLDGPVFGYCKMTSAEVAENFARTAPTHMLMRRLQGKLKMYYIIKGKGKQAVEVKLNNNQLGAVDRNSKDIYYIWYFYTSPDLSTSQKHLFAKLHFGFKGNIFKRGFNRAFGILFSKKEQKNHQGIIALADQDGERIRAFTPIDLYFMYKGLKPKQGSFIIPLTEYIKVNGNGNERQR